MPVRPRRVVVAGTSGSGKSTVAARLSASLAVPYVEIDSLFHGPGWSERPSFVDDVHRFTAQPAWVIEWQYDAVRPHLLASADLMVWLDLPRAVVMSQVVRRTLRRRFRREALWNGNHEPPLRTFFTDDEHIVRYAWRVHADSSRRVRAAIAARPDLVVVRLRSRAETQRWMNGSLLGHP